MIRKLFLLSILGILVVGGIIFSYSKIDKVKVDSEKIQIITSFYPYYFFTSEIGGNKIKVTNITPAGAEPHDYEPTSSDIVQIESSRLLILNGLVEPWANKIKGNLANKETKILEVGNGLFNLEFTGEDGKIVEDPHIWLSPRLAKKQAEIILKQLQELDPKNNDYYQINAMKLLSELDNLDKNYQNTLSKCEARNIITSHEAFGYLAKEYGLIQTTIAGISPDDEPSLKRIAELSEFVRKNNIKYIFFESLVSPKFANTIASETGAKTLVLNPIEGLTPEEIEDGENYLTVMQKNLQNLKIALQCQ